MLPVNIISINHNEITPIDNHLVENDHNLASTEPSMNSYFFCELCGLGFKTKESFNRHCSEECNFTIVTCRNPKCNFSGKRNIVLKHEEICHRNHFNDTTNPTDYTIQNKVPENNTLSKLQCNCWNTSIHRKGPSK